MLVKARDVLGLGFDPLEPMFRRQIIDIEIRTRTAMTIAKSMRNVVGEGEIMIASSRSSKNPETAMLRLQPFGGLLLFSPDNAVAPFKRLSIARAIADDRAYDHTTAPWGVPGGDLSSVFDDVSCARIGASKGLE